MDTEQKTNGHMTKHSILSKGLSTGNKDMEAIFSMMEKLLHWAAIIDSSDDAIISKSIDGYITSWNRGAQRLYGYTPEEIIGQPVSILMPPSKKDDFPFIMKQLQDGKRVEHYETQRMTKEGKILHVSITVSPIRDSQGNIIGAAKIARDITEKIENERRRDEFVSTTSHELKTPLTSQKIFGDLLAKQIEEKGYTELKPLIQKMNKQIEKLGKLVEDLLELSRAQGGRLSIHNTRFCLNDLIREMVENVQLTTKQQILYQSKEKIFIYGDSERIGQVLTNILSNALKYSPKAEKVIVKTHVKDSVVTVSVQDFGIGISKDYHERVFERFFRVAGDDEKTYPGLGIGLFLCREIITRHNGKIWVDSEKGKGSTFSFTLPIESKL